MAFVDSTPVYWSFVQSASSQAQLTATLAGISITAMVLVLSPLFMGPRMDKLGADHQDEIHDLFKFLLIAFTTLVAASMFWGQLNGYSTIESQAWQNCTDATCPNARLAPLHLVFLCCASLTTLGVVALSVALLELVLLSTRDPARLSRLVLAMYAVTVSLASLQVMFGVSLVGADRLGQASTDETATGNAALVVPVIVVVGLMPAVRSWWRRRTGSMPLPEQSARWRSKVRVVETTILWVAGLSSAVAVQLAPEYVKERNDYGTFFWGDTVAIVGGVSTAIYACLIWWSLWAVIDRLSAGTGRTAPAARTSLVGLDTVDETASSRVSPGAAAPDPSGSVAGAFDGADRPPRPERTAPYTGSTARRRARKPGRPRSLRHGHPHDGSPRLRERV